MRFCINYEHTFRSTIEPIQQQIASQQPQEKFEFRPTEAKSEPLRTTAPGTQRPTQKLNISLKRPDSPDEVPENKSLPQSLSMRRTSREITPVVIPVEQKKPVEVVDNQSSICSTVAPEPVEQNSTELQPVESQSFVHPKAVNLSEDSREQLPPEPLKPEIPAESMQLDPSLSSQKRLEFLLGRGPSPEVEKSRAISRGEKVESKTPPTGISNAEGTSAKPRTPPTTPPTQRTARTHFNPVMSQLKRETQSRQTMLDQQHSTDPPPPDHIKVRSGRESFLGLGATARVKMKISNIQLQHIPQFKKNVVEGLTETIVSLSFSSPFNTISVFSHQI